MKLNTRGRYAITAMLDLTLHQQDGPVRLSDIARRQGISLSYLEQLFRQLRCKGLVSSRRGPRGGYTLARKADEISVAHIIFGVEEGIDMTRCGGQQNCQGRLRCLTHDLWMGMNRHMAEYLNGISLAALAGQANVLHVARCQDAMVRTMPLTQMSAAAVMATPRARWNP